MSRPTFSAGDVVLLLIVAVVLVWGVAHMIMD